MNADHIKVTGEDRVLKQLRFDFLSVPPNPLIVMEMLLAELKNDLTYAKEHVMLEVVTPIMLDPILGVIENPRYEKAAFVTKITKDGFPYVTELNPIQL